MLLNEKQAAAYLNIKPQTLTRWRWAGKGPKSVKVGGAVRYRAEALEEFITEMSGGEYA